MTKLEPRHSPDRWQRLSASQRIFLRRWYRTLRAWGMNPRSLARDRVFWMLVGVEHQA